MVRELKVNIWCDPCLQAGEGQEPTYSEGEELPPIVLGSMKPRVLAMCERHRKELYDPFRELVASLGQVAHDTAVAPQLGGAEGSGRSKGGPFKCPDPQCDRHTLGYAKPTSLRSHTERLHGKTVGELREEFGDATADANPGLFDGAEEEEQSAGKPPEVTRTECEHCDPPRVFEWPANPRPAQALGVHKARVHGIHSTNAHAKRSRAKRARAGA